MARDSLQLWDLSSGSLISDLSPSNKRVYLYGEFPYAAQFYRGDTTGDLVLAGGAGLGGLQVISVSQSSVSAPSGRPVSRDSWKKLKLLS